MPPIARLTCLDTPNLYFWLSKFTHSGGVLIDKGCYSFDRYEKKWRDRDMRRHEHKIKTLSTGQVAWLLGTNGKTVNHWVDSGIIKAWRTTCRGDRQFQRDDIGNLLARLGA